MSTYAYVKCMCAHRKHRGQCPNPACGCLIYRPPVKPAILRVPRVVRGAVVREIPKGA